MNKDLSSSWGDNTGDTALALHTVVPAITLVRVPRTAYGP